MEYFINISKSLITFFLVFISSLNSQTLNNENLNFIPENKVISVIDGDTIDVFSKHNIQRVRLLGINTPETVDPKKGVECFGPEASNKLKELLTEKVVTLETDTTQGDKDKYGRLLRYVILNGENINQKMVKEGYAFEYTYKKPYKFQKDFKLAQSEARKNNIGLWDSKNCDYLNLAK